MTFGFDPQVGPGNGATGVPETVFEVLERWQSELRPTIGPNFTITPAGQTPPPSNLTVEQVEFGLLAREVVSLQGAVCLLYAQISADTAEGKGLDALYAWLDIRRRPGEPTLAPVFVVGEALADLGGQTVVHDASGELFRFPAAAVLTGSGSGSFTLSSLRRVAISVVDNDSGWTPNPANAAITSITAVADGTPGAPPEGDVDFRARAVNELGAFSTGTDPAIRTAVSQVANVTSVASDPNRSNQTNSNGVPPWHYETIVRGGTDLDVADAIDRKRHGTMATFGSTTVTASSGREINFTRAGFADVAFSVVITNTGSDVVLDPATRAAFENEITRQIVERVNALPIEADVSPQTYADIMIDVMPDQSIFDSSFQAARLGDPLGTEAIGLGTREQARLSTDDITVTII